MTSATIDQNQIALRLQLCNPANTPAQTHSLCVADTSIPVIFFFSVVSLSIRVFFLARSHPPLEFRL